MRIINQTVHTKKDGSLDLNISTQLSDKDVQVVVIINEKPSYIFSDLIGKLQWSGDPLQTQKN